MRAGGARLGLAVIAGAIAWTSAGEAASAPAADAVAPVPAARFAVIIGVNQSVDKDAPPLHYADDDAAGFLDLFRALGARTYVLSRFDDNTRRLHPQAVAEAQEPRRQELERIVDQVAIDVAKARERHVPAVLYFVYAGHGNVDAGRGYLALEDARLFGGDIERLVLDRVHAAETHIIVDACYSVFLAFGRGPGGEYQEAHGFSGLAGLAGRADVGLLLSTSSARESHEWSQFQAGIFSHEVRSGLLGAADANRNGRVTYRELAAFIDRANASVPNEKFRPDVYVKEPSATADILDLRAGLGHRLDLDGDHPGHYLLEDTRGVRLADFNNAPGQALSLIRLVGAGPLFLRRVGDGQEFVVGPEPEVLRLDDLVAQPSSTQPRGAAHESFSLLFSLPFSQQVVDGFVIRQASASPAPFGPRTNAALIRPLGLALMAAGVASGVAGTWAVVSALSVRQKAPANQAEGYQLNQQIDHHNTVALWCYGLGGAALAAGALLLLWPHPADTDAPPFALSPAFDAPGFRFEGRF